MKKLLICLLILTAIFFRLYRFATVPPSASLDEASIGYNAYSILKTGRDEYGTRLPILLRAYDDWRPAGYVYLVVPFIKLFGLSTLAVRLPAVILSLVTVLAVYFLVREVFFPPPPRGSRTLNARRYALIASFLLAISPWHIYLSRLGHEVNAGLAFLVFATLFFVRAVNRQKAVSLSASAIFFSLSLYTYQSQKIIAPLLVLILVIIYRKVLVKMKKGLILAIFVGLLLSLPILKASLAPEAMIRFRGTSIFTNSDKPAVLVVSKAYFSHFNPKWLLFNSGREDHKVPGMGVLYVWELPLILIGVYQLIKGKFSRQARLLILAWILIAPLPASITTGAPHAMRIFNLLPMPQILGALGAVTIISKLKISRKTILALSLFLFFNLAYLYHHYFVSFPHEQSNSFQYPLAKAIDYVLTQESDYQKIVFSNQDHAYQSYMFYLFFSRYDPGQYLADGGTISGGFAETHQIGKYEFRPINWSKENKSEEILYVGNVDDFPSKVEAQQVFKLLDGQPAIKVIRGDS